MNNHLADFDDFRHCSCLRKGSEESLSVEVPTYKIIQKGPKFNGTIIKRYSLYEIHQSETSVFVTLSKVPCLGTQLPKFWGIHCLGHKVCAALFGSPSTEVGTLDHSV